MNKMKIAAAFAAGLAVAFAAKWPLPGNVAHAQAGTLSALDYQEITQLINRYAYGIDTCANNGYDYANLFTTDGVFIDDNSDAGFAAGGRVLAQGRDALAELVGGGSRGCKTKLVWTDWSHLMLNHEITPTADGARGRVYLVQLGMDGSGQRRAPRRLRGRVCPDGRGLAHQVAHACPEQGLARAGAADPRSELAPYLALGAGDGTSPPRVIAIGAGRRRIIARFQVPAPLRSGGAAFTV